MTIAPHIVLVHGLGRTPWDMRLLAYRLSARFPQAKFHRFGYDSRRLTLSESSKRLGAFVNEITQTEAVSFIGHSLGGIVVRSLDLSSESNAPLHRLVTLGSPHKGAKIARTLSRYKAARSIFGPVLDELGELSLSESSNKLEIGCIIGKTGVKIGFLPFLGGDNDGLVLSSEASFSGSVDSLELISFHGLMPFSSRIAKVAGDFLETGRFKP